MTSPTKRHLKMKREQNLVYSKYDLELRIFHKTLINLIHFGNSVLTCIKWMTPFQQQCGGGIDYQTFTGY